MKDKYMLEVNYPSADGYLMVFFTSDTPFQAISKGDTMNTESLPDADRTTPLRVTSVEHVLWTENGESKHKICVYTEGRPDDPARG